MEMWIEFKHDVAYDGYEDPRDPLMPSGHQFERDTDQSTLTRGQLACYAAAHMGTQFRVHAFSLLLCGNFGRFFRWDRAGAVVSQTFNYIKRPKILAGFLWRYNHLSLEGRGHDLSVSKPTQDEIKSAREHLQLYHDCTFVKLLMPRGTRASDGHYVIPSPRYTSRSPFGRATRPSRAYSVDKDKAVFYKDYWRIDGPGG